MPDGGAVRIKDSVEGGRVIPQDPILGHAGRITRSLPMGSPYGR